MATKPIKLMLPDFSDLATHVLHLAGYRTPERAGKSIRKEMETSVEKVLACLKPESIYKTTDFEKCENGIVKGSGLHIQSDNLSSLVSSLNNPESIACFAVTLGQDLDDRIREAQDHAMTQAFFMDAAGSAIAEIFASQAESQLQTLLARKNLTATRRFSPGYCDWDLRYGQDAIQQFIDLQRIGIRNYPSGMMIPEKTVTAVMLGARGAEFKTPCPFCDRIECPHRRIG
ncbi:MAG: hypothetical protein R6X10_09405 [Desulfobacterales bacterium]